MVIPKTQRHVPATKSEADTSEDFLVSRIPGLVPADGTLDQDGMISSPTANERYPGRTQERFLSLVPAVRIVRVHVLPSTADSKHASEILRPH
ncbi:hypothetical protein PV325_012837, partial [Microctonus aethiopoides]